MRDDRDIERELHTAEADLEIRVAQLKHALDIPIAVATHVWPAMGIALVAGALLGARR